MFMVLQVNWYFKTNILVNSGYEGGGRQETSILLRRLGKDGGRPMYAILHSKVVS